MSPFALYVMSPTVWSASNVFLPNVLVTFVQSGSTPSTWIVVLSSVIADSLKYLSVISNTTVTFFLS